MKALVQRVNFANLKIDGETYSKIEKGILVLLGIEKEDSQKDIDYIVKKVTNLRIFEDENGKMNLSVKDIKGEIMIVSQFTLCADCKGGNRPSFINAQIPEIANEMYEEVIKKIKEMGIYLQVGMFGADMKINLENDGPVTIMIESK